MNVFVAVLVALTLAVGAHTALDAGKSSTKSDATIEADANVNAEHEFFGSSSNVLEARTSADMSAEAEVKSDTKTEIKIDPFF